jgi:hypothetical protein
MRYVSGSLAFPGLKPQDTPNPYLPTSNGDGGADTAPESEPSSTSAPSAPTAQ